MTLQLLFEKIKHLPGQHSQQTHAGKHATNLFFDPKLKNEEIDMFLKMNPGAKPVNLKMTDKDILKYKNQYDFWIDQDSSDARKLESIEKASEVPPIIVSGNIDHWWVTDGAHRLAVQAKNNNSNVLAYIG